MLKRSLTTTVLSFAALTLGVAMAPADEIAKAAQNGDVVDLTVTIAATLAGTGGSGR